MLFLLFAALRKAERAGFKAVLRLVPEGFGVPDPRGKISTINCKKKKTFLLLKPKSEF